MKSDYFEGKKKKKKEKNIKGAKIETRLKMGYEKWQHFGGFFFFFYFSLFSFLFFFVFFYFFFL